MRFPLLTVAALFASVSYGQAESTRYPLTLSSCGHEITFERAPESVVSVGQSTTAIGPSPLASSGWSTA